ncbi:nicotinate phosphoribosyltransferase [Methylobacter tundripaludum]|uniref:Nicotinate phosphoribosyltransferase n=1 Tax=Methylobacter tundripaludum (strain ATCC BAA-1195 / DSM 17260 / SV96) TaxID=697282 RepID=G3IU21_METTV|nr:nicotinate phosphoribosyltransferase [Methylobacter tundripaludum]EGW21504.1 nicotinate phosphoribosyltransferase [Methylobacter tundripaludum SV96]
MPDSALLTDLYQLTMLQGYYEQNMEELAVFEFFVRKLPETRGYLVAAGLAQVLIYLEQLRFSSDEIEWLASTGQFKLSMLDRLKTLKFTGDVHAMPEGTVFFPNEPILRITAPLPEAQLVESRIINLLHFQTLIASKAARSVLIAPDKLLVDFGMRRAHGSEAALLAARASYLAGFTGSATVAAGMHFGIPIFGTMAHSFIQAYSSESQAFADFAKANPDNVVFLVDTYDTEAGAQKVVDLAAALHAQGIKIKGVRIDSGDLADHARKVRTILDRGGLNDATLFASGNIDEHKLAELIAEQAPIDGFGIGTRLDTSADAPYLDCAYKLQEYAGIARRKRSEGKATWPGRKQVYRNYDNGIISGDTVTVDNAPCAGQPLLQLVMQGGKTVVGQPTLVEAREYARCQLNSLPMSLRQLSNTLEYPVIISAELQVLAKTVDERNTG